MIFNKLIINKMLRVFTTSTINKFKYFTKYLKGGFANINGLSTFSTKIISDILFLDEKTVNLAESIKITDQCAEVKFTF
jgi:hypothetical protein